MKKNIFIYILFHFLAVSSISCVCTSCIMNIVQLDSEESLPVTITVETGSRGIEGTHPGNGIDSRIDKIRVLGYRVSNGMLAFNSVVTVDSSSDPANGIIKGTVDVLTGLYDFVFIANEESDTALTTTLSDNNRINTLPKLKGLSFSANAFTQINPIPMVSQVNGVKVIADNTLQAPPDLDIVNGTWNVEMERLAVRVDLQLEMSESFAAAPVLSFENVPDRVYLFQQENIGNTGNRTMNMGYTTTTVANGNKQLKWSRMILPESWFASKATEENGITVCLTNAGTTKKARLGLDPGTNYTMPRNHYFDITGTVSEDHSIDYSAEVEFWDVYNLNTDIGSVEYFLLIDSVNMEVNSPAQYDCPLKVTTNYTGPWSAVASSSPEDPDLGYPVWFTPNWSGNQYGSQTLTFNVASGSLRNAYVHITVGRLTVVVKIRQYHFGGAT